MPVSQLDRQSVSQSGSQSAGQSVCQSICRSVSLSVFQNEENVEIFSWTEFHYLPDSSLIIDLVNSEIDVSHTPSNTGDR